MSAPLQIPKTHGQRAAELLSQVSVTADKTLEAATVHAILHLADQVAALGREQLRHPDAEPANYAEQQGLTDDRPHSRACGFRRHPHGPECHPNCPTCGNAVLRNAAMTEALRDV